MALAHLVRAQFVSHLYGICNMYMHLNRWATTLDQVGIEITVFEPKSALLGLWCSRFATRKVCV